MEKQGYIKLFRKMVDWEWYTEVNTCHLFMHMIIMANHDTQKWRGETIERGSFVTSYGSLSHETGLTVREVRTALKHLSDTGDIALKATSRNTRIYIVNYDFYQKNDLNSDKVKNNELYDNNGVCKPSCIRSDTTCDTLATNNRQSNDKQSDKVPTTNKNEKKYKNEKNILNTLSQKIGKQEIEEIKSRWNELGFDLPKLTSIKSGSIRFERTSARIAEFGFDNFLLAIGNIKLSKFLQGKNNRNWRITYDWLICPNNFVKVLEGNYTDVKGERNGEDCGSAANYGITTV